MPDGIDVLPAFRCPPMNQSRNGRWKKRVQARL